MHGTIFAELEKFVGETYGGSTWSDLKKGAGIQRERYDVMTDYPDSEVVALVTAASTMTGVAIPASRRLQVPGLRADLGPLVILRSEALECGSRSCRFLGHPANSVFRESVASSIGHKSFAQNDKLGGLSAETSAVP